MSYKYFALLLVTLFLCGCEEPRAHVRLRSVPRAERPPMNLPVHMRQHNWAARNGEGSCVHASLASLFRWHHQEQLAAWWIQHYSGGENEIELQRKLQSAGVKYSCVQHGETWFLDDCSRTRHGCILWWKPGHCCTFCGWVRGADGLIYGVIIDNNNPNRLELTERGQLVRLWQGFGGFALTLAVPPAIPFPALPYEVVQ